MYKRTRPLSQKSALEEYVDRMNELNRLFGHSDDIEFPLSEENVRRIAGDIEAALSPENLNCDGEISPAQANERYRYLKEVLDELQLSDDWGVVI